MKALIYKELKLAMHPMCWVFVCAFPLMMLIPSYPIAIGFIYVLSAYPILFLGANKGQQSNDLLYSVLLPIRKRDIVKARIFTVSLMHFIFIAITSCLYPLACLINSSIPADKIPGLGLDAYVSVLAIALIGYAIADFVYFSIYYRRGKSIVLSTLLTILAFIFYLALTTIIFPYVIPGYTSALSDNLGLQFVILGIALVLYVLIHMIIYKVSSKELEQVDF